MFEVDELKARRSIVQCGFWFIDIPRTSSSSIRSELGRHFGSAYGKTNVIEKQHATKQLIHEDHVPAIRMQELIGNSNWDKIFKFTFVRNPWDRIYSMYNYRQKVSSIPREWSFREYVIALEKASPKSEFFQYHGFRFGASEYILGKNGEIIVNFIGKYENRSHDLNLVASHLNLNDLGKLHIQRAQPRESHYSYFYDSETEEIIRRLYSKDIELFNYEFDNKT